MRGSSTRQFWFEQPFDLEEARALMTADVNVVSDDDDDDEEEEEEEEEDFGTP